MSVQLDTLLIKEGDMFANAALYLAAQAAPHVTTHDTLHAFGKRLVSNHERFWICILAVAVVMFVLRKSKPLILTGIGSFWLTWYLYNSITGDTKPLFIGETSPSNLTDIAYGGGWGLLAMVVGIGLGIAVLINSGGNVIVRVFGAIATWATVMLIYSIILVQWLHLV